MLHIKDDIAAGDPQHERGLDKTVPQQHQCGGTAFTLHQRDLQIPQHAKTARLSLRGDDDNPDSADIVADAYGEGKFFQQKKQQQQKEEQ